MNPTHADSSIEILLVEDNPGDIRLTQEAFKDGRMRANLNVVMDGIEQKAYDGIGSLAFSPDSKHFAYVAISGSQQRVVLDGSEQKLYNDILKGTLAFSPDSEHLVYGAGEEGEEFAVLDGRERKHYQSLVTLGGGSIVFGSAKQFHYLALLGTDILLVREMF